MGIMKQHESWRDNSETHNEDMETRVCTECGDEFCTHVINGMDECQRCRRAMFEEWQSAMEEGW